MICRKWKKSNPEGKFFLMYQEKGQCFDWKTLQSIFITLEQANFDASGPEEK